MTIWIAGRVLTDPDWELQGVFSTEQLAVQACRDETYFIGPMLLDESLPHKTVDWPGAYYPKVVLG